MENEKETFEMPEVEIVTFEAKDIIMTSGGEGEEGEEEIPAFIGSCTGVL